MRAVAFSELPAVLGLPSIHDRDRLEPLLPCLQRDRYVICMHIGSSSQVPITSTDARPMCRCPSPQSISKLSMCDWLLSGHLVRFPDLKLACSEGQVGWMPYLWERLDGMWRKRNYRDDWDPVLTEPPATTCRVTYGVASSRTTSASR